MQQFDNQFESSAQHTKSVIHSYCLEEEDARTRVYSHEGKRLSIYTPSLDTTNVEFVSIYELAWYTEQRLQSFYQHLQQIFQTVVDKLVAF